MVTNEAPVATNEGFDIRVLRWRAGVKQFELAGLLQMRAPQLSAIENGRAECPPGLVERVHEVLASRNAVPA